jgi:hypothetical protein
MKFVALRSFDDYISAHILLGRLREEGIDCHLQDEHTSTTAPFLTSYSGGIKLMVAEAQVEKALHLLEHPDPDTAS